MNIDIKKIVKELVEKIQKDPALVKQFGKEPIKVIEKLTGLDLPDDQLEPIVAAVKAKLATADVEDALNNLKGLGNLFKK